MSNSNEIAAKRSLVIGRMISSIKKGEYRDYFVGLVGYFIEDIPYSASGLTVDASATVDMVQTPDGFTCTAFFPPEALQPSTVKKNGLIQKLLAGQMKNTVKVRLEVKSHDIWSITEHIDQVQHELFIDPETLGSRKMAFFNEMHEWFRTRR